MKSVTLEEILNWNLCYSKGKIRCIANGRNSMTAMEIAELDIPIEDRLYILLREHFFADSDLRMLAAAFAELVLPIFEREHPGDNRPRNAIKATRLYALGEIDDAARDAARAAARAAAWTAAWAAAWAAVRDAAWAAAWAAARAAARAAASDAAWAAQIEIVKVYLSNE